MRQQQATNTINIETLIAGEYTILKTLAKLHTKCLSKRRIPRARKNGKMVLIYNKEIRKDLKCYISICLISNIYKVFTEVLTKRLEKTLNENQPRKQAGFRSRYSMTDHIHVVNQLKEKCNEYNIPPCITFIEYVCRLSANPRTGDRICVLRTPEGSVHQQFHDNPTTQ